MTITHHFENMGQVAGYFDDLGRSKTSQSKSARLVKEKHVLKAEARTWHEAADFLRMSVIGGSNVEA